MRKRGFTKLCGFGANLVAGSTLFLLLPLAVYSQGNDGCADVLALTGRDELFGHEQREAMREIYEVYCSGSQIKSGVDLSLGVEDLLGGFNLGFGTTKEKVESVCREYSDFARQHQTSMIQISIVVKEAIAAWRDCKRIASNGLDVDPKVLNTQFAIDFHRWGARDITLNGFHYDPALVECRGDTADGQDQVLDRKSKVTLTDDRTWSAVCRRISKDAGSIVYYPEVEVSVPTTANGTFNLRVPRSALPELTWALQIKERLNGIDGERRTGDEELSRRLAKQRGVESVSCKPSSDWLNGWDNSLDAQCASDEFLHGLHSVHSNEHEDRVHKFYCCKLQLKPEG